MYQKQRNFRSSIRGESQNHNGPSRSGNFNNPQRTQQGQQSNRNFGSRHWGNRPKSKLSNNISMFIKKAVGTSATESFTPNHTFADFNISPALKQNILSHGYTTLTPIQDQAIEPILEGRDFIGVANTGTGKTAAFLIPLIDKIYKDRNQKALIIAPTRELATQIYEEFHAFTTNMKIYSAIIIGGANISRQIQLVRRNPHVIIATPGRLKDLIQRRMIYLEDFNTFILDEVDLMVDIGFLADIKYFISLLPKERQSLFFSATIGPKVHELLHSFVIDPVTVSVKQQDTAENINQDVVKIINREKKVDQLHDLLISDGFDKVLIFGRTKRGIEQLNKELDIRGFKVGAIHSNKTQGHRQRVLNSFKQNEIQILLATDVASRGLDIDNVTHVINYDLPETYDDYVHRIGRTGRAGKAGTALTFID